MKGDGAPAATLGRGRAYGAITILNGTATGIGCSLAVEAGTDATWQWTAAGTWKFDASPVSDDRLALALARMLDVEAGKTRGANVTCTSSWLAQRGLKTSSAAAAAMLRAALPGASDDDVMQRAVAASRAAGVTLTGAWDDQAAVVRGGCHLADSRAGRILCSFDVPRWHVAVWVADVALPKERVAGVDVSRLAERANALARTLTEATVPETLTRNGELFHAAYAAAGLPVTDEPTRVALRAGALGAGLSGCGPSIGALFEAPVHLPPVHGGRWVWTRAVPA